MADVIWTKRLEQCRQAVLSSQFQLLVKARLLELLLDGEGRVAIEAAKLLYGGSADSGDGLDAELMALPPEQLESAYDRAIQFILSVDGGASGGGEDATGVGAGVLSALRTTDYAKLPGSTASSVDHERVDAAGTGSDHETYH